MNDICTLVSVNEEISQSTAAIATVTKQTCSNVNDS